MINKNKVAGFIFIFLAIFVLFGVHTTNQRKVNINELALLAPESKFWFKKPVNNGIGLGAKEMGDFFHCLKTYKPLDWRYRGENNSENTDYYVNNNYRLDITETDDRIFYFFLYKYDEAGKIIWESGGFAAACPMSLINQNLPDTLIAEVVNLEASSRYKELYVSHPDLDLPDSKGELGKFAECLNDYQTWDSSMPREQGMIKLNLKEQEYFLHLGVKDNKAINFVFEKYENKKRTLATSKTYSIDCDLDLLNLSAL